MKRFLLISTALFLLSACQEKGCTNSLAVNYDVNAGKDNGSCFFEGSMVFWLNKNSAETLRKQEVISLSLYINGQKAGVLYTSQGRQTAPDCGDDNVVTFEKELGKETEAVVSFEAIDQKGRQIYKSDLTIRGGICAQQELGS